jgi:nucleolar protein 56
MLKKAKEAVAVAYANEDHSLIQSINSYLELSKSHNLISQRLVEWFGIYFPEVKISSQDAITELALLIGKSEDGKITLPQVETILAKEGHAAEVHSKMESSRGRVPEAAEKKALASFAQTVKEANLTLLELDKYIDDAAKRIMPNATFLTEPKIAAELLSKAGSLEKLASMPASTIQLLGAEKALFKHIKFGSKPPKYGVLFKLPAINNGRHDLRGKMARAYAAKIAIALRADYFSKNYIADKLKEKLDETIKGINQLPETAPRKDNSWRGRSGGRPPFRGGGNNRNFRDRGGGDRRPQQGGRRPPFRRP